jgi:hypothetical protein
VYILRILTKGFATNLHPTFKYYSLLSDDRKTLFETEPGNQCQVDFMREVSWFLGCKYEWGNLPNCQPTLSITQTSKAQELMKVHGMKECNPVAPPYHSGLVIDGILDDSIPLDDKLELVKNYQSLVRDLLWL